VWEHACDGFTEIGLSPVMLQPLHPEIKYDLRDLTARISLVFQGRVTDLPLCFCDVFKTD